MTKRHPKLNVLSVLHNMWRDRKGIAATEFALLMPVLVILFFGVLELSEGMTANRRVAVAVNTAADLAAQSETLNPNEIDGLLESAIAILEPASTTDVDINLVSLILDQDGNPVVHWSVHWKDDVQPIAPYQIGDDYERLTDAFKQSPYGLAQLQNRSMIIVELTYPYRATFAKWFLSSPVNFDRTAKRAPRQAVRVQLCDNNNDNCTI